MAAPYHMQTDNEILSLAITGQGRLCHPLGFRNHIRKGHGASTPSPASSCTLIFWSHSLLQTCCMLAAI